MYIGEPPRLERADGFILNPPEAKTSIGNDSCALVRDQVTGERRGVRINCLASNVFTTTWFRDDVMLDFTEPLLETNGRSGNYTCVVTSECGAMDSEFSLIYG